MSYETVIGLEVHLQLATRTKAFCGCSTKFGQRPNSQVCPVCLGFPGSLPSLNEEAFRYALKVALALNCQIQSLVKFDRKNYYYPDLPKNFQISQYDMPLSYNGFVDIAASGGEQKRIRIKRVHMEEDAGKLMHPEGEDYSLVDYNRGGMPLLEIVTEPDISSPQEAYDYLMKLKSILEYLKVSDCDMEKGSLRCDANVSIRPQGAKRLGTKVELKNMNSFRGVRSGLEYEVKRQVSVVEEKGSLVQETRLWDTDRGVTVSMRVKEEAEDYRYFPEPDLVPFVVDKDEIEKIRRELPELPEAKAGRFKTAFGLSDYDAGVLTSQVDLADYYEECVKLYPNAKTAANWMMGDIMAAVNTKGININELALRPEGLAGLLKMIDSGAINGKMAKEILSEAIETGTSPQEIVKSKGLSQISDGGKIEEIIKNVLKIEAKSVNDYRLGKKAALGFLIGQVMKESKGKANPAMVNEILKKILGVIVLFLMLASLAIGGYAKETKDKPKSSKSDLYGQLELFADAISLIRTDYVDEVDSKKLIYGAMRGMLSNLDDYSQFMDPEEFEEIKSETKGEFGGVGTEISLKDGSLTVITPISGTPAYAAGIKPGDKIVKIDGRLTKSITLNDAVKEMRGKPGTTVTLTIWREKGQKVIDIPIKRAIIKIRSVKNAELIDDKIGYIKLAEFQDNTARDLDEALKKLESQGMDSLIFDLRYNPGGVLDGAVDVSERFLPKDKLIVSIKSRTPEQNALFKSSGKFTHPNYPIIVLVNEGSASASEIVSGAIQDNKRGLILGTKTYGKASVQTVIPLKDGSALRLTTASYLTPSGKLIKGQGIAPDVVVELRENKVENSEEPEDKEKLERDNQLDSAVNLMKAIKTYSREKA